MRRAPRAEIVDEIARTHGEPAPPPKRTKLEPGRILAAPIGDLLAITRIGGIHPELRAHRLHEIAELVQEEFGGDLDAAGARPAKEALAASKKFPAIGRPGAEKILLMNGAQPLLALESNGPRALVRLGFGTESSSCGATWRSVAASVASESAGRGCAWLARAHHLLRHHSQTLCRRSEPRCLDCPRSERFAWRGNAKVSRA